MLRYVTSTIFGIGLTTFACAPVVEGNFKHDIFHKLGIQKTTIVLKQSNNQDLKSKKYGDVIFGWTDRCVTCGKDGNLRIRPGIDVNDYLSYIEDNKKKHKKEQIEHKLFLQDWHNPFGFERVKHQLEFQQKVERKLSEIMNFHE